MEKSNKKSFFSRLSLLILLSGVLSFASCTKDGEDDLIIDPPTGRGFFIVNEGWFGHGNGSLNLYNYGDDKVITDLGIELGVTTCYSLKWKDKGYFMVSKMEKQLVKLDNALKETGVLGDKNLPQGRAFAVVNDAKGVLTTSEGAYVVDIEKMELGVLLEGSDGQCGGVFATDKYVFVMSQDSGILVYDVDFKFIKNLGEAGVGFEQSKDGSLWAANIDQLIKIDPKTLITETISLPSGVKVYNSWGSWNKGGMVASKTKNELYIAKFDSEGGGGHDIYRYEIGNIASLNTTYIEYPEEFYFYGSGIGVDPLTNDLIATYTKAGYGDGAKLNRLVIFDGKTKAIKNSIDYEGYYFPAMILFQ